MTHRSPKSRLLAPVLAAVLAPMTAFAAVTVTPLVAEAAVTKANCQVTTVLMSKDGDGTIPPELEFMKPSLQNDEFAAYKGFHLIERKAVKLALSTKTDSTFTSGHRLGLTLMGGDEKRLKLHADLSSRDGSKSLVSLEYSIENDGLFMIGAGSYSNDAHSGKLFFAIQCGGAG